MNLDVPCDTTTVMLTYRLLADLILLVHFGIVLFVVFGLLVTVVGLVARWAWVRNFWFRMAHLAAIIVIVLQAWLGVICPLTTLEMWLRDRAGDATYQGSFVAHWVSRVLFYDNVPSWVFTVSYTAFGLAVLATFILGPPRSPGRRAASTARA